MKNKKKTFSINPDISFKFEKNCRENAINQSLLVQLLIEAYLVKGQAILNDVTRD